MDIISTIKKLQKSKKIFFTTPGHALGKVIPSKIKNFFGEKIFKADFSEVEGLDILSDPSGCILKSQQKAAKIYNTKASFYLVNGSSSGILAIMLAALKEGEKVLVARNCHKCVYNGLILTGAIPVWFMSKFNEEFGIFEGVMLEDVKKAYSNDIKAIIITSPTYEGVCSEIEKIAEFCREKNIIFIVDEAHGALFPFSEKLPKSAIELGADACVQSLHKNTPALNSSAILHLSKNSKLSEKKVQDSLNIITTTSPSFLLLASIEADINFLNSKKGRNKLNKLIDNINTFKHSCPNIDFLDGNNNDTTKIVFKIRGITGEELADILNKNNIEEEFCTSVSAVCIANFAVSKKNLNKLKGVLNKIKPKNKKILYNNLFGLPKQILTPKAAHYSEYEEICVSDALNRISGEMIIQYPPGIPLLVEGELINKEHLKMLKKPKIKVIKTE